MQGLGHRLVVAASDLLHGVGVELLGDSIDCIDRLSQLVVLLLGNVQDPIGVPAPLCLHEVPYLLNWIEFTALWRKVLKDEHAVVELLFDSLAVMCREVDHHHDPLLLLIDLLECLNE